MVLIVALRKVMAVKKMQVSMNINVSFGSDFQREMFVSILETFMRALAQDHEYRHKNNRCTYLISRKEV